MPTLTAFVGLPGSGKSHAAAALAHERGLTVLEDAFHPDHADDLDRIVAALAVGDCVIDSVELTQPKKRERLVSALAGSAPAANIDWVYFRNDPVPCIGNIVCDFEAGKRANWMDRIKAVLAATDHYVVGDAAKARPVHKVYAGGG